METKTEDIKMHKFFNMTEKDFDERSFKMFLDFSDKKKYVYYRDILIDLFDNDEDRFKAFIYSGFVQASKHGLGD